MTDFDTEILNENERCELLPAQKDPHRLPRGRGRARDIALAKARRELEAKPPPETLHWPEEARAADRLPEGDPPKPAEPERPATPGPEPEPQAEAPPSSAVSEARRQQAARRRMLARLLASLVHDPEPAPLATLMQAYRAASEAEADQAATAVLSLYLRAETEERRRLRPVLAEAIRRAPDTELALALHARLGAIALPRPTPPPDSEPEP